jgi:shikimate kinase
MKTLLLYGPPAVGKLTIATQLATATGFSLFHNHEATNLARSIMSPRSWKYYSSLATEIRLAVVRTLLACKVKGLVMTYAFGLETFKGVGDLPFVTTLRTLVQGQGGCIFFIKLEAPIETLASRVGNETRRKFGKLTDPQVLRKIAGRRPLLEPIPDVDGLTIDTSLTTPAKSVALILKYFHLKRARPRSHPSAEPSMPTAFDFLLQ